MKSIDTLVDDIYGLFSDDKTQYFSDKSTETFATRLSEKIRNRINDARGEFTLRLSNIGTACKRQLWYRKHAQDASEPLPPEARIKFLFGDILEEMLLWLAAEAGHIVEGEQDEVSFHGIKGHRDAVIDGRVVDCKSASSYSFNKFANHLSASDDAFGYLPQIQAYRQGSAEDVVVTDKDRASFLVIDKTLGKITLDTHDADGVDYAKKIDDLRQILESDQPPPRDFAPEPFGASGNEKLGVNCSYCAFKKKCYPELRTFIYSTGPVFLTKVKKLPYVPEVS